MRKVLRLALWAAGGGLLLASAGAGVRATATAPYYTDYQTAAAGVINTAAAIHHKLGAATDSETPACRAAWLAAIQKLASLNTSSSTGDVDAFVLSADSYTTLAVNELGVDIAGTDRNDNYDLVVEFFELADRIDDAKPGLTTSATADTIYGNIIEEFKEGRGGAIGATDYLRYIRAAKLALAQGGIDFTDGAYYDDYQSAAAGMMHTAASV